MCRTKGSPKAFRVLEKAMEDGDVEAAKIILAYAWGRPPQSVEVTGKDGGPLEVADARERIAQRLAALLAARSGGGPASGDAGR